MSTFTYRHARTRSRSRERTPPPLPRRTSFKRQRLLPSDSDDEYDDYPYSGAHRPSHALVTRTTPSQLERWNIWSSPHREERCDSGTEELSRERRRRRVGFADEVNEDEEREFRLRVARLRHNETRLSPLPARYRAESEEESVKPGVWGTKLFRRERCVSEDFELREYARLRSMERRRRERLWVGDDGDEFAEKDIDDERMVRYSRVKRTRTDEWRPLTGFRRT